MTTTFISFFFLTNASRKVLCNQVFSAAFRLMTLSHFRVDKTAARIMRPPAVLAQ
jgi:hypothetical protein